MECRESISKHDHCIAVRRGGITREDAIEDDDTARAAYAVIAARAQGYNHLQWQTPSLALTAEAFVLQIALGHESTPPARLVASTLNLMLSLLCICRCRHADRRM
jgi:hypothetical protein